MNKTLLLIICDFLLLNLLALTSWEKAEPTAVAHPAPGQTADAGASSKDQDLVETMRLSLEDERSTRTELATQLASLESEKSTLASSLANTQQQASDLDRQLVAASQDASATKERLAQLQREFDAKQAEAAHQREQVAKLEKANAEARERIEGLAVAVKVAEQEKQIIRETAETYKQQAEAERQERQKVQATTVQLAQGVGQLAEKSGELTREIRDNRPINANVLFNEFLANRVEVKIAAERDAVIGSGRRESAANTVLVTDGRQTYAVLHIDDTPFSYQELSSNWLRIGAELSRGSGRDAATTLHFLSLDPRVLVVPVEPAQVALLGAKVYQLALEPFKFPDAMLVNQGGKGYGEVPFKLDPQQPAFVRMDNRFFKKLVGDFTPSRGDLVFSKTGELLGIMVSNSYCALLDNFLPARSIKLGDTSGQETGRLLSEMASRYRSLPFRMQ